MSTTRSLLTRRRSRRYGFALMPLADTMFQLLIFFMLSSNLTPFSMITLRSATVGADAGTALPGDGSLGADERHVWTLRSDAILYDEIEHGYHQLTDLARGFADAGDDASIVVVVHSSALMQNLASVLEALRVAGIERIQISPGGL